MKIFERYLATQRHEQMIKEGSLLNGGPELNTAHYRLIKVYQQIQCFRNAFMKSRVHDNFAT